MNLKRTLIFVVLLVLVSTFFSTKNERKLDEISKESISQKKEYEDVVITLLLPEVKKAVDDFYEPYLTNNPMVMRYDIKIQHIDIEQNDSNYVKYIVTVEAPPFLGPHRYIGKEKIVLNVYADGNVSVRKYEHLKSEEISPLDKPLLMKPLPRK